MTLGHLKDETVMRKTWEVSHQPLWAVRVTWL